MWPAARALRAPPLPRLSRRVPLNGMTAMTSPPCVSQAPRDGRWSARRPRGSYEQRTQRSFLVDALDGLAEQPGDRELGDPGRQRPVVVLHGVGDHQLLDGRVGQALLGAAAQDAVRDAGVDV